MEKRTRRTLALVGVASMALVTAGRTAPASQTTAVPGWAQVDCDKEPVGAVQRAVDRARPGDTCHENVTIPEEKARLTLDGGGTATIVGPDATRNTISISGKGITVTAFTVTGGRTGIDVVRGGTALIDGNIIEGTGQSGCCSGNGITVGSWGAANIVNNTIQNNLGHGIQVIGNSFAFIGFRTAIDTVASPNVIRNNGSHGIHVTLSSSARIAGNTISDNARNGINVERASQTNISDNTIEGNGQNGIFVSENAGVNLGSDTGSGIFDASNRTTLNNGQHGIRCRVGGYANGRLGTLNGNSGPKDFGASCLNSLDTQDNF